MEKGNLSDMEGGDLSDVDKGNLSDMEGVGGTSVTWRWGPQWRGGGGGHQ